MSRCVVCNSVREGMRMPKNPDKDVCSNCEKEPWNIQVKLLQLRRIADALENIEKKMSDRNKW